MKLTKESIEFLRTDRGGFTKATLNALGLSFKTPTGWIERLIGKEVSEKQYKRACLGKTILTKEGRRKRRKREAKIGYDPALEWF